jgi:outer membrane protein insertion porin family
VAGRLAAILLLGAGLALAAGAHAASEVAGEFLEVSSVGFEGNEHYGAGELRKWIRTRTPSFPFHPLRRSIYRRDFIRGDADALVAFYRRQGYLDATVEDRTTVDPERREVDVAFTVSEGRRYFVSSVDYEGVTRLKPPLPAHNSFLRVGAPYNPFSRESERERLLLLYADLGFYPQVRDTVTVADSGVAARFTVVEGEPVRVRQISLASAVPLRNRPFVVRRELKLRQGSLLARSVLEEDKARLYSTDLFEDVQISPVNADSARHTVDLEVRLRERKQWWLSGGVGYGSQDQFRLLAETGTRSLFWTGRRLVLSSVVGFGRRAWVDDNAFKFQETQLSLTLAEQHVLRSSVRGQVSVYYLVQPDTTLPRFVRGATLSLRQDLSQTSKATVSFDHRGVTMHSSQQPPSYISRSFNLGFDRDVRDNAFDPSSGSFQEVNLQAAGGVLGGNTAFLKQVGSVSAYRRLGRTVVLAARVRAGFVAPLNRPDRDTLGLQLLRTDDRFRTGGATTVRGYSEDEIGGQAEADTFLVGRVGDAYRGGRVLLLAGLELRFPVWGLISGAVFLDGGNVWRSPSEVTLKAFAPYGLRGNASFQRFRYSMGGGLRLATPVGPFRVDYGVKLNPPEVPAGGPAGAAVYRRTQWHFSLGQAY